MFAHRLRHKEAADLKGGLAVLHQYTGESTFGSYGIRVLRESVGPQTSCKRGLRYSRLCKGTEGHVDFRKSLPPIIRRLSGTHADTSCIGLITRRSRVQIPPPLRATGSLGIQFKRPRLEQSHIPQLIAANQ